LRSSVRCRRCGRRPTYSQNQYPVVSVVWTYSGLLPKDMSSGDLLLRAPAHLAGHAIEHIRSQSLKRLRESQDLFQKDVNIGSALAQVTACRRTVLKLLPPASLRPMCSDYNASSVRSSISCCRARKLPQDQLFDLGQNSFARTRNRHGAALPCPMVAKFSRRRSTSTSRRCIAQCSADDVSTDLRAELFSGWDRENRQFEWNVDSMQAHVLDHINDLPVKKVTAQSFISADVAYGMTVRRRKPISFESMPESRADVDPQCRVGFDARHYRRHQARRPGSRRDCRPGLDLHVVGINRPSSGRRLRRGSRRHHCGCMTACESCCSSKLALDHHLVITIPLAILSHVTALSWLAKRSM